MASKSEELCNEDLRQLYKKILKRNVPLMKYNNRTWLLEKILGEGGHDAINKYFSEKAAAEEHRRREAERKRREARRAERAARRREAERKRREEEARREAERKRKAEEARREAERKRREEEARREAERKRRGSRGNT